MKLNDRLKLARTQKGFTQQEVADILHISRATVSSWEVGRTLPSLDFIVDLSNLYELSLDILLKEDMVMINQMNKELRTKKIYKGIVLGVGFVLSLFILFNVIWLFNVKNQYRYINKNWEMKNDIYVYKEEDIFMQSPQLSFKDEFKFHYLKPNPLHIVAYKGEESEKGYTPSVVMQDIDKVFANVPIDKKESTFMNIRIDKNGKLLFDDDNPDFLSQSAFSENITFVHQFLETNSKDFKELYSAIEEQYKLVNKVSG